MNSITVEPQNPLALGPDDVADLVQELKAALPAYEVRQLSGKEMPRGARGVTFWDVIRVYLPEVGDDVRAFLIAAALGAGVRWAKRLLRKKTEYGRHRRPKCLIVHSADGAEQGSMVLRSSRHKPVTKEAAVQPVKPRKPKPSRKKTPSTAKSARKKKRR
jgi:hypothetical protein